MELCFQDYQQHVAELIQAALAASDPATAVTQHLHRNGRSLTIHNFTYNLDEGRVFLISIGKAAVPMGIAAAQILGHDLTSTILITKKTNKNWQPEINDSPFIPSASSGQALHPSSFILLQSGHPISDEDSVAAATAVTQLLSQTTANDLVLCLISGGASAIFASPLIPLADWQQLNHVLLTSGCTINELNCVRQQLDQMKGGGLARLAAPATCVGLILSDVVGSPLDMIGSGPTVPTTNTPADALAVLSRYDVTSKVETAVWQRITQLLEQIALLPPIEAENIHNQIVGDGRQAAHAAFIRAAQLGFLTQILTTRLEGEAREVGRVTAGIAKDLPPGHCLIMGGETTVTVRGDGRGGRNQEMALSAAIALEGWPHTAIACFATDGEDGPTDVAGAVVTGETAVTAQSHNLNPATYLSNNDSYTFFQQLDSHQQTSPTHLKTGPTGTNVNDLLFILSYPNK